MSIQRIVTFAIQQILQIQHVWTLLLLNTIKRQIGKCTKTHGFFLSRSLSFISIANVFFLLRVIHLNDENKNHFCYTLHTLCRDHIYIHM